VLWDRDGRATDFAKRDMAALLAHLSKPFKFEELLHIAKPGFRWPASADQLDEFITFSRFSYVIVPSAVPNCNNIALNLANSRVATSKMNATQAVSDTQDFLAAS
jgi:hypothetical protein